MKRLIAGSLLATLLLSGSAGAAPAVDSAPPLPSTLDLPAALGFALEHNFSIREARERIHQQQGVVVQVSSQELPSVKGTGSYQENSAAISQTYPQGTSYWNVSLMASQTLYAGGGVRSAVRNASLTREAAIFDLQATINAALLDVRTKFYNVLLTKEKLNVQEENIRLLQSQLKDATDRFEAGTTSSFDKLRADVALANGQVPLIDARNDYRIAIEQLRESLGLSTETKESIRKLPEVVGELRYESLSFDLEDCLSAARANRPELQRLAKLRQAGEQNVTTAKSTYYPNIGLTGGWEAAKNSFSFFGGGPSYVNGWLIALQGQWAIFDGRATAGRVIQARSQLEQSRLSLDEESLDIDVAVRQAYSSWQEANELADATRKTIAQAEESLRLANARYEAGSGTQLDVLQSRVDLTQARTNLVQASYTYAVAVATLREAMGIADEYSTR